MAEDGSRTHSLSEPWQHLLRPPTPHDEFTADCPEAIAKIVQRLQDEARPVRASFVKATGRLQNNSTQGV